MAELGAILGAHAPNLMQRLYYLKFQDDGRHASTFGVTLRNAAARHTFVLDYGTLVFAESDVRAKPAAVGVEIWASDLEILLAAEEDAFMVMESAVRTWSHAHSLIDSPMLLETFLWFTPRFRPGEYLRAYRARIAELRAPRSALPLPLQANGGQ